MSDKTMLIKTYKRAWIREYFEYADGENLVSLGYCWGWGPSSLKVEEGYFDSVEETERSIDDEESAVLVTARDEGLLPNDSPSLAPPWWSVR